MTTSALLLVLTAAVCHATWNILQAGASRAGTPFLLGGAVVSTVVWLFAIPFTGGMGRISVGGFVVGIVVTGLIHLAYMLTLQHGYAVGRLSTVYASARGTGPALSVLVAVLLLGERPSVTALCGVAVVILGVVAVGLVDREPRSSRRGPDPGLVWGMLAGVTIAAYTIWDTTLVRSWGAQPVAYMVGSTAVQSVLLAVGLRRRGSEVLGVAREMWPRLLAFGVLSPLAYILVLVAVRVAPVSLVAPLREVSVVLVAVFGAVVLREGRVPARLAAAALVVGGIALLAF